MFTLSKKSVHFDIWHIGKSIYRGEQVNKIAGRTYQRIRMGSRPFLYGIRIYRERMLAYMSETTIEENSRKLRYFADIFLQMKRSGKINTTDPRHIGEVEIEMFSGYMRKKGLSTTTRRSYLKMLNSYLRFFENDIIDRMKHTGKLNPITKGQPNPVRFLEIDDLQQVFDAADLMNGYRGIVCRGFLAITFSIAGRPKEIIEMHREDIDLRNKVIFVRHPKGEGSYGKREWIPIIREDMIPRIESFLDERDRYFNMIGLESCFLFANTDNGGPLTLKSIRKYKTSIEKTSGVRFQLKDLRSTYATITYSGAPDMKDAISKQMRHCSSTTTEKYYIAYDQKRAANDLKNEWKKTQIIIKKE